MELEAIIQRIRDVSEDPELKVVQEWRAAHPDAPLVGFLPAYAPREIIHAAGGLAVGIWGGGLGVEIVQGDAFYQSYICHLPRSVIELAQQGVYKDFSGVIFPSICDVIRNLSGMWKLLYPHQWAKYLELPQNLSLDIGGQFYRNELLHLVKLVHGEYDEEFKAGLREAIKLLNRQREALQQLKARRRETPHLVPIDEYYYFFRSALVLPVEEHLKLLEEYLRLIDLRDAKLQDNIRVLVVGAFCEQPPMGLLKTIELAGCYIVDHDFLIGVHLFREPLPEEGDPLDALVKGYLELTPPLAFKYQGNSDRGAALIETVRRNNIDGVIFAAPSFCDPALLERPMLQKALERAGIPSMSFKYAENTGQYQPIREQAGTFSDSIRLWVED